MHDRTVLPADSRLDELLAPAHPQLYGSPGGESARCVGPVKPDIQNSVAVLFEAAAEESITGAVCAEFLVALRYPELIGPLNIMTLVYGLTAEIVDFMARVVGAAMRLRADFHHLEELGCDDRFQRTLTLWYPEHAGLPSRHPTPGRILMFMRRHDLSIAKMGYLLSMDSPTIERWLLGSEEMPLCLWNAARILTSEWKIRFPEACSA